MKLGPLALLLVAAPVAAGPLADSLKRHSERDVAALREQRSEVGARCTLGAVYAKRKDLPRAHLYLRGCADATLPDEIAAEVGKLARTVARDVEDSELSRIEIVTSEDAVTLVAEITALPGETFDTPATLYVKPGAYAITATRDGATLTREIVAEKRSRAVVIFETAPRLPQHKPVEDKRVDFTEEHGSQTQQSGPPPDIKHPSILPDKYKQKRQATADNPNAIADPFELGIRRAPRAPRPFALGLRLGGGMFDDGAAGARAGIAVAATTRIPLAGPWLFAGRADYSRRGSAAIDTLGASAGVGRTVMGVALVGQLRADLRLGEVMASRAGLAAAVGGEVALPRTPLTAGVRLEQGLTTIAPGTRDRAVLLELGVDWR